MITVERATDADLSAIRDVVAAAGLPLDGLGDVPTDFIVARDDGRVVGTAALEHHGGHGLLRSVAVIETLRRRGSDHAWWMPRSCLPVRPGSPVSTS